MDGIVWSLSHGVLNRSLMTVPLLDTYDTLAASPSFQMAMYLSPPVVWCRKTLRNGTLVIFAVKSRTGTTPPSVGRRLMSSSQAREPA